jgi:hypothetical protein
MSIHAFPFPVIRRVIPKLFAQEIVSVQPMTAPVGSLLFYDNGQRSKIVAMLKKAGLKVRT